MKPYEKKIYTIDALLIAFVRRHPYFTASLILHVIVLFALYGYGSFEIAEQQYESQQGPVAESIYKAESAEIKNDVATIETMKQLIEDSMRQKEDAAATDKKSKSNKDNLPAKNNENTPDELLAKAKDILADIKKLEKEAKAEELARVLDIPKEDALKKIEQESPAPSTKPPVDSNNISAVVKQIKSEAKTALVHREQQLATKKNGTQVKLANNNDLQHGNGSESGNGKGNADKEGNAGTATNQESNGQHEQNSDSFYQQKINSFLQESTYGGGNGYFDNRVGYMPSVTGREIKKTGRIIGEGGEFSERLYLNSWYVIGPFDGNAKERLFNNPSYPPEQLVDLDAVYFGKQKRILKWNYVISNEYPFIPPDTAENAVYYGYSEIGMVRSRDLWVWFGADDDLQVWLNDKLIWRGGNVSKQWFFDQIFNTNNYYKKTWNLTEGKRLVHFEQGKNRLLFKLSNGPNPNGLFASIILTK